jgi:hypothetical protein
MFRKANAERLLMSSFLALACAPVVWLLGGAVLGLGPWALVGAGLVGLYSLVLDVLAVWKVVRSASRVNVAKTCLAGLVALVLANVSCGAMCVGLLGVAAIMHPRA